MKYRERRTAPQRLSTSAHRRAGLAAAAALAVLAVTAPAVLADDAPSSRTAAPSSRTAAPAAPADAPPAPFEPTPEIRAAGRWISAHPGGIADKGDRIVEYIFDRQDGLGFRYREHPTLSAAEAFEQRAGNCLTLVNLFIALARSAGLPAYPIEVGDFESFSRRGGTVLRSTHVIGGLEVGGEAGLQVWTVDFLPDRPKAYRRVRALTDDRYAALFYNSVAAEALLAGELGRADRLFRTALAHDPAAADAWSNWAVHAARSGDRRTAHARYAKALELEPTHLSALTNLAALHRLEGRTAEAEVLEARALAERSQSPYFLAERALRELRRSRLDEAERLLRRARAIDETIPEIHLALGRIDLERGREARAQDHFAEARRRAVEETLAFRAGLDRKIGKLEKLAAAH